MSVIADFRLLKQPTRDPIGNRNLVFFDCGALRGYSFEIVRTKEGSALKRSFVLSLICIILASAPSMSQTRRRTPPKRVTPTTSFEEKKLAELRSGRQQIANQIKALSQFLFLFGSISKGIETAEQVNKNKEQTSVGMPPERIEQSKTKLKEIVRTVRTGLDQLESSFRLNPILGSYYPNLAGVAKLGQAAEAQAAANTFDQSGRSLIAAVNKLADALAAVR